MPDVKDFEAQRHLRARKYTSNSIKIYVMLFNPLSIVQNLYKSLPNPLEFAGGEIFKKYRFRPRVISFFSKSLCKYHIDKHLTQG